MYVGVSPYDEKHMILLESYEARANLTPLGSRNLTPVRRESLIGYEKACWTNLPLVESCQS